jgi:mannosidase alpha-like ER degradation enhancer 1
VFEADIRIVGGLLSAHLLAKDEELNLMEDITYEDTLLHLAQDLGNRLLPAFATETGIPYAWINLR